MRVRLATTYWNGPKWRYAVAVSPAGHNVATAWRGVLSISLATCASLSAQKMQAPAPDVSMLVGDAVRYQLADIEHPDWALRYRVHRVDGKEDTVRDLIETGSGNVARTLQRGGKPLTAEEDAAEQQRLRGITATAMEKRRKNGATSDRYTTELIGAMPRAMLYTLAADQLQLPQFSTPQIVLDYVPNPNFQPASTAQALLTGLAGRMWIDATTHHLLRIEVKVIKNLNLALGLLARVYPGGTVVYEQHPLTAGHYAYTHIEIEVVLREFMVKTVPYHSTLDASDAVLLPTVPTLPEAVSLLLHDNPGGQP